MKQEYVEKKVISICGVLDKDEHNEYIVNVEEKDNVETYPLEEILDAMCGQVITLKSDIF